MLQARAARLNSAVDRRAGVLLRLEPKGAKDNWGNVIAADSRLPRNIVGTFFEGGAALSFFDGDRTDRNFSSRAGGQNVSASFDNALFTPETLPRKGDVLKTIAEPVVREFEILDVTATAWRVAVLLVRK